MTSQKHPQQFPRIDAEIAAFEDDLKNFHKDFGLAPSTIGRKAIENSRIVDRVRERLGVTKAQIVAIREWMADERLRRVGNDSAPQGRDPS